ncbi:hypothetical protein [Neosynechococcus sphagnicola]|uniref:hypothetical protein n=1 Tax=Neosynechococcus sphagnicola TaxID=1501145 RepID=UPI00138E0722|nr:hypothetical protein [Neosynechococcus sphagnicola]
MFERGSFLSFANCGLPYYVGDVITDEKKLLVANADLFRHSTLAIARSQYEGA